jgi:UDP-N-acetylglucosamine--N-acetylmuramyl-(pentapeptide) pyrophosphoryl-undecaprenol N-acetylglucosamine transferase
MESRLVPPRGFVLEPVDFSGVRGKGFKTLLLLPWRLLRACAQSASVLRRVRPDVVLGLGGYISFPGGLMAALLGKPLVLHEQNSVAGLANRLLARLATRVFEAFPGALQRARCIGNPLRAEFLQQDGPQQRFAQRSGPLRLLVVGGSLGASALNRVVPQALAQLDSDVRPQVLHQSGQAHIEELRQNYAAAGVSASLTAFIDDVAPAYASADLIICRAGASTVTEIAAIGAAALFVPFPAAVDDHQTHNARFLVDQGGGWLMPQSTFTPELLAQWLRGLDRVALLERACRAKALERTDATEQLLAVCEELAS